MARTLGHCWRNRRANLAHGNLSYHLKFESTKSSTLKSLRGDCKVKALNATRTLTKKKEEKKEKKKEMASRDPSKISSRSSQRSPSKLLVALTEI